MNSFNKLRQVNKCVFGNLGCVLLCISQILCYVFILINYSLSKNINIPHFALDKIYGHFDSPTIRLTLLVFMFESLIYLASYFLLKNKKSQAINLLLVSTLICIVISIFIYPIGALDIFYYIAESKVFYFYQTNPYINNFNYFSGDILNKFGVFLNAPLAYGPVWLVSTALPVFILGFSSLLNLVIGLKIINVILLLGCGFVIYLLAKKSKVSFLLFASNPFIVYETIINGHNDILMAFLLLLSLLYLSKNKSISTSFLFLSVLTKYFSLIFMPIFVAYAYVKRWSIKRIVDSIAFGLTIALIGVIPFCINGLRLVNFLNNLKSTQKLDTFSVFSLLREQLEFHNFSEQTIKLIWFALLLFFIGYLSINIFSYIKGRTKLNSLLIRTLSLFLILLSSAQPWYFIPLIALLCIELSFSNLVFLFCFTFSLLMFYPLSIWAWFDSGFSITNIHMFQSIFILAPFVIYLLSLKISPKN